MKPSNQTQSAVTSTIAIAATFTAEPVEDVIRFWARTLEQPIEIAFAPYSQVFPQLLDPQSLLARNGPGLNVVLIRWEDLGSDPTELERVGDDLARALSTAIAHTTTPYLVAPCPSSRAALDRWGAELQMLDARLLAAAAPLSHVHVLRPAGLLARYAVGAYDDVSGNRLGHVPYTPAFFAALGTAIVRRFECLHRAPYKVIALDCDETLWKGVCGEVGPHGIEIDAPRRQLQEFMVARQQEGMLLCLCSRNNEDDVAAVFSQRSDMPLKLEHVVASRINWNAKSANLRSLASELGLGLDSFIFIDDDPIACADVASNCPEVLTLQLPAEEARIPSFLDHVWAFDRRQAIDEDRERTERYRDNLARERVRAEALTLEDFFAALELDIRIQSLERSDLGRVAQHSQRTNQFNLTTIRRSEADLVRLLEDRELEGVSVVVSDRFGSYGLVGAVLFECRQQNLRVDSFLLSCRALGRGVEHQMLNHLGDVAKARGCDTVALEFRRTSKNAPAYDFLRGLEAASNSSDEGGMVFRLAASDASAVRFVPARSAPTADAGNDIQETPSDAQRPREAPFSLARRIATELSTAAAIRSAVDRARRRSRPEVLSAYAAPANQIETTMADLWSEVLGIQPVGVDDSFFALGGHSLLATMLVSRMQVLLGEEIPLDQFFLRPTIAGVLELVQHGRIRSATAEDIAETLRFLDQLSDAEVERLVNECGAMGVAGDSTTSTSPRVI